MDISKWSGVVVAVIAASAALIQSRHRPDPRGRIRADIEILSSLPDDAAQRENLQTHIDHQIEQLIDAEVNLRRDGQGLGVALFLIVLAGAVGYLADATNGAGSYLLFLAASLIGLLAIVGFFMSVGKTHRDAKGNRTSKSDTI